MCRCPPWSAAPGHRRRCGVLRSRPPRRGGGYPPAGPPAETPAGREDDLEAALALERGQVPAEERRIANELVGGDLEEHDDPGLVELGRAPKMNSTPRVVFPVPAVPSTSTTLPRRSTAGQDVIQPRDAGLDEVPFRHGQRHLPEVTTTVRRKSHGCSSRRSAIVAASAALSARSVHPASHTLAGGRRQPPWAESTSRTYIRPGAPLVERPPQQAGLEKTVERPRDLREVVADVGGKLLTTEHDARMPREEEQQVEVAGVPQAGRFNELQRPPGRSGGSCG